MICAFAIAATAMAQRSQTPVVFRSQAEYLLYQVEHPELVKVKNLDTQRWVTTYSQKLDSVIGSDDFDRTRWKNVYSYGNDSLRVDDALVVETHYVWEDLHWVPSTKTATMKNVEAGVLEQSNSYRWNGEDWEPNLETSYQYGENQLLESLTVMRYNDSVMARSSYATYEYDDLNRLTRIMNYRGTDTAWIENSKYEYLYNADGLLDTCLYSTIRDGSWRESERMMYSYDENQQCISLFAQRKGGWGPFGNSWMNSYRYEFEYADGELATELYYASSGWFGGEMSLNSKLEYAFDANGNLQAKTGSVFNEQDWIVRDVYENSFDLTVEANSILGLQEVWESTLSYGMGYVLDQEMPVMSQWNSCIIASVNLDTEFHLYYSGFAAVEENETPHLVAFGKEGRLVVSCPEACNLTVYDLLGRVVATRSNTQQAEFPLAPGLYVVSNGIQSIKTIIQ